MNEMEIKEFEENSLRLVMDYIDKRIEDIDKTRVQFRVQYPELLTKE